MPDDSNLLGINMGNKSLHFAFLFASPLVRKTTRLMNVSKIDYRTEIKNLKDSLKNSKNQIYYSIDIATNNNCYEIFS